MKNIVGTYEILGAMSPLVSQSERDEVISKLNTNVTLVANTDRETHLALPYYEVLDGLAAVPISDDEFDGENVVGGEIWITLLIAGVGLGASAIAIGGGIHGTKEAQKK